MSHENQWYQWCDCFFIETVRFEGTYSFSGVYFFLFLMQVKYSSQLCGACNVHSEPVGMNQCTAIEFHKGCFVYRLGGY